MARPKKASAVLPAFKHLQIDVQDEFVPVVGEREVEVELLNPYVPYSGTFDEYPDVDVFGKPMVAKIFHKVPAGEVLSLPVSEAKRLIKAGKAKVTADLI
jgi:hypothetical protein